MQAEIHPLGLILVAIISLAALAVVFPCVNASVGKALGPNISVVNKVPDFYAEGKGEAYSNIFMKISSKGGYLNTGSTVITLTPWGYVSADWTIGRVYVIFLINVTETNFYIAYLYLTNSSTPMIVRLFEYRYATLKSLVLTGVQYIFQRYTTTIPVEIPAINFNPKAQPGNSISAIGPELYINQDSGQAINGTSTWKIYPILEQYFQGDTDYNEIWTMFTDDSGAYYFGIFYAPNSDPSHILVEHQIRLNDYKTFPGRTFDAAWTKKGFPNLLTIKLPQPSVVKVAGFPFQSDSQGEVAVYVPKATLTIEAPDEINPSGGTRWHFSSWQGFGGSNPLTMKVGSPLTLVANYNEQYLLTIDSPYPGVAGAGWYDNGANATFSAPDLIPADNGTRHVFLGWNGDYASTSNAATLPMTSAKHIVAMWKTQYQLKLQLIAVPSNATAQVAVNGQTQIVSGSEATALWFDADTPVTIQVQSTQISGTDTTYNFGELRVDNQTSSPDIIITKPITVDLVYSASSKSSSAIDLNVNNDNAVPGQQLIFTGKVSANPIPLTVSLLYSSNSTAWQPLASVTTANDGTFSYTWKPDKPGTYYVRAYWPGDDNYSPSSSRAVSVRILNGLSADPGTSSFPSLIRTIMQRTSGVPVVSPVIAFAGSLLTLGMAIGALVVPTELNLLGYFIGSLFIGFVFVFPISAIALSVKAFRSHRPPGLISLIPFAAIWTASVVLLFGSGVFFFVPAALLDVMLLLLVVSSATFIPLAFSVALARVVAD